MRCNSTPKGSFIKRGVVEMTCYKEKGHSGYEVDHEYLSPAKILWRWQASKYIQTVNASDNDSSKWTEIALNKYEN